MPAHIDHSKIAIPLLSWFDCLLDILCLMLGFRSPHADSVPGSRKWRDRVNMALV